MGKNEYGHVINMKETHIQMLDIAEKLCVDSQRKLSIIIDKNLKDISSDISKISNDSNSFSIVNNIDNDIKDVRKKLDICSRKLNEVKEGVVKIKKEALDYYRVEIYNTISSENIFSIPLIKPIVSSLDSLVKSQSYFNKLLYRASLAYPEEILDGKIDPFSYEGRKLIDNFNEERLRRIYRNISAHVAYMIIVNTLSTILGADNSLLIVFLATGGIHYIYNKYVGIGKYYMIFDFGGLQLIKKDVINFFSEIKNFYKYYSLADENSKRIEDEQFINMFETYNNRVQLSATREGKVNKVFIDFIRYVNDDSTTDGTILEKTSKYFKNFRYKNDIKENRILNENPIIKLFRNSNIKSKKGIISRMCEVDNYHKKLKFGWKSIVEVSKEVLATEFFLFFSMMCAAPVVDFIKGLIENNHSIFLVPLFLFSIKNRAAYIFLKTRYSKQGVIKIIKNMIRTKEQSYALILYNKDRDDRFRSDGSGLSIAYYNKIQNIVYCITDFLKEKYKDYGGKYLK